MHSRVPRIHSAHLAGIACAAAAWMFTGPLLVVDEPRLGIGLLLVGFCSLVVAHWKAISPLRKDSDGPRSEAEGWKTLLACGLALLGIGAAIRHFPRPFDFVLVTGLATTACGFLGGRSVRLRKLAEASSAACLVLVLQACIVLLLLRPALQGIRTPFVPEASAAVMSLLGWDAGAGADSLFLVGQGMTHGVLASFEKVWTPFAPLFLLSILAARWLHPWMPVMRVGWCSIAVVAYAVLRFASLACLLVVLGASPNPFVEPLVLLGSWIPLVLIVATLPLPPLDAAEPVARSSRAGSRVAGTAGIVAGLSISWALAGFDPGRPKGSRILIDDSHGDWESTSTPFDKQNFSTHSGYSYTELRRLLSHYYEVDVVKDGPLDEELLRDVDVLVLKTPLEPYLESERDAITEFARAGGGVLLIGDHTNFLGMSSRLNYVASPLGIAFRPDHLLQASADGYRGEFVVRSPTPRWADHPAMVPVDSFFALGGCSFLVEGPFAETVLWQPALVSESADYSSMSFFDEGVNDGIHAQGPNRLAAAASVGRGRLLALGDSTIFSNFTMHEVGRLELFLGSIEFLRRENMLPPWHRVASIGIACVSLMILFVFCATRLSGVGFAPGVFLAILLVVALVPLQIGAWKRRSYAQPEPSKPLPVALVAGRFDSERGSEELYVNAFNALARYGLVPRSIEGTWAFDASGVELIAMFEPSRRLHTAEVDALAAYVRNGGRLLLLDSPWNRNPSIPSLIGRFGMAYEDGFLRQEGRRAEESSPFSSDVPAMVLLEAAQYWSSGHIPVTAGPVAHEFVIPVKGIRGGEPLLQHGPHTMAAMSAVREGKVLVCTAGAAVGDRVLGDPFMPGLPGETVRGQYAFLFDLLDQLLSSSP